MTVDMVQIVQTKLLYDWTGTIIIHQSLSYYHYYCDVLTCWSMYQYIIHHKVSNCKDDDNDRLHDDENNDWLHDDENNDWLYDDDDDDYEEEKDIDDDDDHDICIIIIYILSYFITLLHSIHNMWTQWWSIFI